MEKSDKIKVLLFFIFAFPLFLFAAGTLLKLDPYNIGVTAIIIDIAVTIILFGILPFSQSATSAQVSQVAQLTRIFGARGSIIKRTIVLVIILAVLWPFIGPADKTYGAEEFKKLGCNVDGDSLVLSGSGSECQLTGTEKMSIAKVVIIPESLPTGAEVWTLIGPYQFKYSSYSTKQKGTYYKGQVYEQKWGEITYAPVEHGKPSDMPLPIMIQTNYWYIYQGYPSLWIKSRIVYENLADGGRLDNDPLVQGLVSIKSGAGQTARVKEVKIYYGSLLWTILGAIGMS